MKYCFLLLLPLTVVVPSRATSKLPPAKPAAVLSALPGWFEPNAGQHPAEVAFFSRGSAGTLLVQRASAVFLAGNRSLQLRWHGSNPATVLEGGSPGPARTSYFTGADPSRWARGVQHYSRVHNRRLYPGIDLVYYVADKQVEFDLVVAPGADPKRISLSFEGAGTPVLSADGDLMFANGMRQKRPVTYQESAGGRVAVDAAYRIAKNGRVSFEIGEYDRSAPLIIDPVLHAGYLGGDRNEAANAVAVDSQGNVWVAGSSSSTVTLPDQYAPIQDAPRGGRDAFLAKLTREPSGRLALAYWTQLGGSADDDATAITLDSQGFVYLAGTTASIDLPRAGVATQEGFGGGTDAFVARIKIEDSGINALWFSQYYGGPGDETATALALDSDGAVYVGGYTTSDTLPGAGSGLQCCRRGGYDAFFAKIVLEGSPSLAFGTYFGGTGTDVITGMATDAEGAYFVGYTGSHDFPVTDDGYQRGLRSAMDAFLVKVDLRLPGLDALRYGTFLGGAAQDVARAVQVAPNGDLWIAGYTDSRDFPITPDAYNTGNAGETDVFLMRFDYDRRTTAEAVAYSTYVGGNRSDVVYSLSAGPEGTVALSGYTYSEEFPLTDITATPPNPQRGAEAFVLQLDPSLAGAQALLYSTVVSGSYADVAAGVAVDARGNMYAAGFTQSFDIPVTDGSTKLSPGGLNQTFVLEAARTATPQ
jgi:hypothetical protein